MVASEVFERCQRKALAAFKLHWTNAGGKFHLSVVAVAVVVVVLVVVVVVVAVVVVVLVVVVVVVVVVVLVVVVVGHKGRRWSSFCC